MNAIRTLSETQATKTSLTAQQNRNILIAGLTCACFSVLASLVTLRWFILMKRSYRHRLIMYLVISDTFKALWYFVFPVVVFSRGTVQSSSGFCQASGFFLALGIEASDFAILMIALHSLIYIFRPPARSGDEGGLYPYRYFIYPLWVALPLLAAALAFVNPENAYTTAGTFCYLPRRPFWYRLALSWIPRYFVLSLIFGMYGAVYIYVVMKFRSFSALQDSDSEFSSTTHSRRSSSASMDDIAPDDPVQSPEPTKKTRSLHPSFPRLGSYNNKNSVPTPTSNPWDEVSFITSKGLRRPDVAASDFAADSHDPSSSNIPTSPLSKNFAFSPSPEVGHNPSLPHDPLRGSQLTGTTVDGAISSMQQFNQSSGNHSQAFRSGQPKPMDPLKRTRKAIRKQLRYLFIYPAVYVLMWIFPFVSHCLLYNDYYVRNPIYWLTILTTCCFSLQAGVDCIVFSWREKPWRRIPEGRKMSFQQIRSSFTYRGSVANDRSAKSSVSIRNDGGLSVADQGKGRSSQASSTNWWEAEGLKRKDSVWMGTDSDRKMTLAPINSADPVIEEEEEPRLSREQRHDRDRSVSPGSKPDTDEDRRDLV